MSGTDPKTPSGPTEAEKDLRSIIRDMGRVLVACSGGVDSTYLLSFCVRTLGPDAVAAVVVDHPLLREGEAGEAVDLIKGMGVSVSCLNLDPRQVKEVAGNSPQRCYHCKKYIFSRLREHADANGLPWVLDGTNADDDQGYRPGLKALEELGVRSPLKEAGLTKEMIRALSRSSGLATWNKPPAPCLATRFPYDQPITDRDLAMVREGETVLRREGLEDLRLRVHQGVARIEVPEAMIGIMVEKERRQRLVAALKTMGYRYVTLDLEGLRSGSMDEGSRP